VLIGLALIVLQWPILEISMYLIDGSPKVESLTGSYFLIRIMAAPATIGLYAIYGWLLGMQNARLPMVLAIVTNMLNLGLNFIFVLLFNMSSDGVALGTAIAQYFGLISGLALLWHYYRHHFVTGSRQQIFQGKRLTEMFSVNRDIFIRTLCLIFTFTFFTAQSASISNTMLAVNTILLQFTTMLSYAIDGFAIAGESLVGKYLGRGVASTFRRAIRYVFAWGMGLALIFTCIFFFVGEQLLHLFTDKSAITAAATPFLFWIILMPIINRYSLYLGWDLHWCYSIRGYAQSNVIVNIGHLLANLLPLYTDIRQPWPMAGTSFVHVIKRFDPNNYFQKKYLFSTK
jgi:MATE family multidrug resistance protein